MVVRIRILIGTTVVRIASAIIYIEPLISFDGQASPRLFIAPEICHEKPSYIETDLQRYNQTGSELRVCNIHGRAMLLDLTVMKIYFFIQN